MGRNGVIDRNIRYAALPSQRLFHRLQARFKGFSGPVGSGKSLALCHEAIKLSYVNPGRTGLIGAPTYPMLRDATQKALLEILDLNRLPYELNKAENVLEMKDTRSRIVFRSVDDFERLRGTNLAWFGLDELTYTPEEAWLRLEARLRDPKAKRLCGFAVWTPSGHDWVYRRFLSEPVAGYQAVIAKAFENRHILDRVPDFYERLKSSYDEAFYRQEVLGEYLNVNQGLVYRSFKRENNIVPGAVDPALPLRWALDFNVDPMSSIAAQIRNGKVTVLDEIVLKRATTQQACEEFLNRFPNHEGGLWIYGDSSGDYQKTTGTTDFQMIRQQFRQTSYRDACFRVPKGNPLVRERVALMNAKLCNALGEVDLTVDAKCHELIKDFEQVSYKQNSMVMDKESDSKRTHLTDALGYLLWQECRLLEPVGEKSKRLL